MHFANFNVHVLLSEYIRCMIMVVMLLTRSAVAVRESVTALASYAEGWVFETVKTARY